MPYKRYIVTDLGFVIDTQMYGFDTAGSSSQTNLVITEDGKVYSEYWSAGNEWIEDTIEKEFIGNIVYSTNTKLSILDSLNYGKEIK